MKDFYTFLLIVAAMAAVVLFSEFFIDAYCSWMDRRDYRRRTNPRNIEKNAQDLLELELQQFLLEEELKEKARNRMEHPSNYSKTYGGGLDTGTIEILAKLTNPKNNNQARMFPSGKSQNTNQKWWGND